MADPYQPTIKRRRPERVHLLYEVEDLGQIKQVELPYILGVMADLSGPEAELPPPRDRQFVEVDQKGFDKVLEGAKPQLTLSVDNRVTGKGSKLPVHLTFTAFKDFQPDNVAEQIPELQDLLQMRRRLKELLAKMPARPGFRDELEKILNDAEKRKGLAGEVGPQPPAAPPQGPQAEDSP